MKIFLCLMALAFGAQAQQTQEIRIVTETRAEAKAEFRRLSKVDRTEKEEGIFQALAQALDTEPTYAEAAATAQGVLESISPKDFINPFWWPAVQRVNVLRQDADEERKHPTKDSDLIIIFLSK
jgi:hypothetical protein